MDKAQVMVRMVVRAFYEPEAVVVIDSLVRHICLNKGDLAVIFQNSMKHKNALDTVIGQLKLAGLIREHYREEMKANAQKPAKVVYYYIDYRYAVDATKYRLHTLGVQLRKQAGPSEEKKEYFCPRCKSEFREIDVIGNPSWDGSTFLCLTCQHELEYVEQGGADNDAEATGPVGQFNKSLGWLITLMQQIDKVTVPATTAEAAFAQRDEPPRPKAQLNAHNQVEIPSSQPVKAPTAVKGLVTGPQKIEVTITSEEDNTAAAQVAAAEQKQRLAVQNALPEWHTHSTVSNEMTAVGQREELARREREAEMGMLSVGDVEEKKDIKSDGLEDIFAELEAEQAQAQLRREREEEEEYEDDDDEDEEEEFEDVAPNGSAEGPPEAKKVKLDVDTPVSQATPASADVDVEDDEDEFEDV